ncbi:MAG: glycosyltransferase family 4 protein [Phycisphaerales bacterium]|nr:glycosyltransferase family 4 protein [Phycisphaerales bacterium]
MSAPPSVDAPARRIHVLHIVTGEMFSRFGRMFRELGLALTDLGGHITFLTDSERAREQLDITPLEARATPSLSGWRSWGLGRALTREFGRCDVAHLWGAAGLAVVRPWAQREEIPLLLHATSEHEAETITKRGLRAGDHVAGMCDAHCDRFHVRWPTLGQSGAIHALPPALLPPPEVRDVSPRGRTLGLVWRGRFEPGCGLELMVHALSRLAERHIDAQLVTIGQGPAPDIWALARRLQVSGRISLVGDPGIWDRALEGADVFLATRRETTVSLAGMLAMSLGRIVIATGDALPEWYVDGETALCVDPQPGAIAEAIRRIAEGDPNLLALGRSAARYVRDMYSLPKLAERLMDTYAAMCGWGEGSQ